MPIYEYACAEGHRFERRQGFHDEPLRVCAVCGAPARRLIQPAPIIFKGSGWYKTDSRPTSSSSAADASKTTSTEATPASTTEGSAPKETAAGGDSGAKGKESGAGSKDTAAAAS